MRLPRFNLMYVSIPSSHIITFILNSILNMAEYQCPWFHFEDDDHMKNKEMAIHHHGKSTPPSSLSSSSIGEDSSMNSNGSSSCISSSDTKDDASSSSSSNGALYDLSDIMAHLPIKRGLSKFYQGKSESFTSLSSVSSLEDLAKKPACRRNNLMKASRSCGNGLNNSYKRYTLPKALISKKPPSSSRAHFAVSSLSSRRGGFIDTKPSLAENFEC